MATAKTDSPAASRTNARASTAAKRPAARRTSAAPRAAAPSRTSSTAERAVLISVGVALIAREKVLAGVNGAISNYDSTAKASAQLRRFERRGSTARNRLEREVRKTRVRVEREVRQTRTRIEREARRRRRDGEELASRVQERLLSLV